MLKASIHPYTLHFKSPAATSRGVLLEKETWFVKIWEEEDPSVFGIGEAAIFRGLSFDDRPGFNEMLLQACDHAGDAPWLRSELRPWPAILFGFETALADLRNGGLRHPFASAFSDGEEGIPINGLVWMGSRQHMQAQIRSLVERGFRCLKLKIGAIGFDEEYSLIKALRDEFDADHLEIRLDANGAFEPEDALRLLKRLEPLGIHSIEQPIQAGQHAEMAALCRQSPIAIALDEELITVQDLEDKRRLLDQIRPAYIILKPALHGSFSGCEEWCNLASEFGINWWFTSALESNVGLNAIAQYVAAKGYERPQGLGTGSLFTNNIPSPLVVKDSELWHSRHNEWDLSLTGML